jgi:hypothetical protein
VPRKKKVARAAPKKGVNPKRRPSYDGGGRAPGTKEPVVPVTVLLDEELFEELRAFSEKFISPSTIKPYGMAAIVRYCVELGLQDLDEITAEDLLYYIPVGPKGEVGRIPLDSERSRKSVFPIHKRSIQQINRHLSRLNVSIIGSTTYVRYFLRHYLQDVRLRDLYQTIPKRHKKLMAENDWTPRKLLDMYRKAQKS